MSRVGNLLICFLSESLIFGERPERITHIAQREWVTVSELLRSLTKNQGMSKLLRKPISKFPTLAMRWIHSGGSFKRVTRAIERIPKKLLSLQCCIFMTFLFFLMSSPFCTTFKSIIKNVCVVFAFAWGTRWHVNTNHNTGAQLCENAYAYQ